MAVLFTTFIACIHVTYAQLHTLKALVVDEKKSPVPFATINSTSNNIFLIADSVGQFAIKYSANLELVIRKIGYEQKIVNTRNEDTMTIVLKLASKTLDEVVVVGSGINMENEKNKKDENSMSITSQQLVGSTLQDFANASSKTYSGSFLPVFNHKENTEGSRYFSDKWMEGSVISSINTVLDGGCLLNYDKLDGSLLMTFDKKAVIEVTKEDVRSFVLRKNNNEYRFERIAALPNNYLQVLAGSGDHAYKLLKLITTRFEKANYVNNGLTESGHNYDEYKDLFDYYILMPDARTLKPVKLSRKSIKDALLIAQGKVDMYFMQNSGAPVNEEFLIGLIQFLK